jgi:hypothetical protein
MLVKDITHSSVLRAIACLLIVLAIVTLAIEVKIIPPLLGVLAFACLALASEEVGKGKLFSKLPDQS